MGFLSMLSPKMWGFIALGLAVSALGIMALKFLNDKDAAIEAALAQANALQVALVETQEQRREAEVERDTVNTILAQTTTLQSMNRTLLLELQEEQRATRVDVNKRKDIFDKHDLQYLANAKPRLIESRMRQGTQEILNALELEVNQ